MTFWLGLVPVLAVAAALFLAPLGVVRTEGVRLLADTDPHYHVLRAERMARNAVGAPWRDPALDWPNGADVPWPPLFDASLVAAAWVADARTRADFALAGAYVPVVLGLLSVLLIALAGRAIAGRVAGLTAAAVAVLIPALAQFAVAGRIDHHVAEILFATAIAAAFTVGLKMERVWAAPLALGVSVALSFWVWMGSTVALIAPCAAIALARIFAMDDLAARGARTLAIGAALGALLLGISAVVFGPPGALGHPSVLAVGGLQVAIVAGVAAFAAIIAWRSRQPARAGKRLLEVSAALVVPAGLMLSLWPALREGVARGLVALAAGNPWYADIREFNRALFGGLFPVSREIAVIVTMFGLLPLVAGFAVPAGLRRARTDPAARPGLLFLAVWGATMLTLALVRVRFFSYFAVPCAIGAALGALWIGEVVAATLGPVRRVPGIAAAIAAAVLAGALLPALPGLSLIVSGADRIPDSWIEATRWLGATPPAPDGRSTVAAPWEFGHVVQYYSDRPVIASPFGTEAGPRALPDWASFLFATDEATAERVLLARGVSHLVLRNPSHELVGLSGYAPAAAAPLVATRDVWAGERVDATPGYGELVVFRLYFGDGSGAAVRPVEDSRLLFESASTQPAHPLLEERVKIFGLVPGAVLRVSGAAPGAMVSATLPVLTNSGREFSWATRRIADGAGEATFRIPYATGANGATIAGTCTIEDGAHSASSSIPSDAVERGSEVRVLLSAARRAP